MAPEPKQLAGKDINEALLSDNTDDDDFAAGIEDDDAPDNDAKASSDDEEDIPPETPEDPEEEDDSDDGPITLRSLLAERNYELPEEADEIEVFGNILDRYSQTDQAYRQLQEENRQYQQQLSWFMQQQGQPQQPQQTQQQTEQEAVENALTKLVAQRPEWKDSYLKFLERDENGRLRVTDGADPTILQKYNQFVEWEREFDTAFKQDPNSFIFNAIQSSPQFQTYFQQQIQEAVGQVQDRMEAHQIAQQIRPYLEDEQGNPNAAGQAYMSAIEHAEQQLGIKGAKQLHTLGLQAAKPYIQYAMAQAQQASQQKPPEKETPSASRKRRQLEFQKNGAAKRSNKNRRKEPKEDLRDEDDMNRYAMALLQEAGIDPHERVES